MNIRTIKKEFKIRGIECEIKRFKKSKNSKINGTPFTIHRATDITLGVNGNGGRLVTIDSIDDIEKVCKILKDE